MSKTMYDVIFLAIIYAVLVIISTFVFNADAQTKGEIADRITETATRYGVEPTLALAMAEVESQFNPAAVGGLGEIGLFQLRPEFHSVKRGQVNHNIDVAIRYIAQLQRRCGDYGDAFFVCFNYGTARKLKHPTLFPYYRKVKAAQLRIQGRVDNVAVAD